MLKKFAENLKKQIGTQREDEKEEQRGSGKEIGKVAGRSEERKHRAGKQSKRAKSDAEPQKRQAGSARSPSKPDNWKKSFKNIMNSARKSQREHNEYYLDADEDHMEGNEEMKSAIDRKNLHKMRYLAQENSHLKSMLEDAEENIL